MSRIKMETLPCTWLQELGSKTLCRHFWGRGLNK